VYCRADRTFEISLPPRHYDLAGDLLADAVERAATPGVSVDDALRTAAADTGRRIGAAARDEPGEDVVRPARGDALLSVLERNGYEPSVHGTDVVLRNCPFHALAERHRTLVCGMNWDLLSGVLDAIDDRGELTARLDPQPGACCVRIGPDRQCSG